MIYDTETEHTKREVGGAGRERRRYYLFMIPGRPALISAFHTQMISWCDMAEDRNYYYYYCLTSLPSLHACLMLVSPHESPFTSTEVTESSNCRPGRPFEDWRRSIANTCPCTAAVDAGDGGGRVAGNARSSSIALGEHQRRHTHGVRTGRKDVPLVFLRTGRKDVRPPAVPAHVIYTQPD